MMYWNEVPYTCIPTDLWAWFTMPRDLLHSSQQTPGSHLPWQRGHTISKFEGWLVGGVGWGFPHLRLDLH